MIKILIGERTAYLSDVNPGWINKALQDLQRRGHALSVGLEISSTNVNLTLVSPSLPSNGRGRSATAQERQVLSKWQASQLGDNFSRNALFDFLNDISRFV